VQTVQKLHPEADQELFNYQMKEYTVLLRDQTISRILWCM